MRILEDIIIVLILIFVPDFILEVTGLYDSIYRIMAQRKADEVTEWI